MILSMAFRNIKRNKRRSFLAALSVCLSLFLISILQGFIGGTLDSMVKNIVRTESGHIRIASSEYLAQSRFMPLQYPVKNYKKLIELLKADPELAKEMRLIAPRIMMSIMLGDESGSKPAMMIAGDPETEKELLLLQNSIIAGAYDFGQNGAIIGSSLAKELGYGIGDSFTIMSQGADWGLAFRTFTISGIFETGVSSLDDSVLQLDIASATDFLNMGEDVQQLQIMLRDFGRAEEIAERIKTLLAPLYPEIEAQAWTEIGEYPRMIKLIEDIYFVIYIIVAFLGTFIISNIMMMVVLERKKEIGILKSMGMKNNLIMRMFLIEGSLLGLAGSLAGLFFGNLFNLVFSILGMDFSKMLYSIRMPIDNVLYTRISLLDSLFFLLLGVFTSAIISYLPARRAARLNATEAIRSV
ncbi:ABC transporter permease [Spirochaetota bacterium]